MRTQTGIREYLRRQRSRWAPTEQGERRLLCEWVRDSDTDPLVDMARFRDLLEVVPDHVAENLLKGMAARDGRMPLIKAGLGYEECLSSVIVDGTAIASSSTENFLFPALMFPANYLQPGGIPGKTIHWKARGRVTTLTTGATLTVKFGSALTNVIPTTAWATSGTITMDTTAQTNSQWYSEGAAVVRTVGSSGTVFAQGDCMIAAEALTIANQHANFMGSAGQDTPAAATVDQTVNQYVSLTGKWSLTTAYSITGHIFIVEALN